jgi:hypothetical protein
MYGFLTDQKKLFSCFTFRKSYKEIAGITLMEWNTVRSLIQNARRNLKLYGKIYRINNPACSIQKEEEGHNNIGEYLRKYLDGELSGPEMQALEKAALEDPFCRMHWKDWKPAGITGLPNFRCGWLQQRLAERQNKKQKRNYFPVTRMAGCRGRFDHRSSHPYVYLILREPIKRKSPSPPSDSGARKSEPAPAAIASDTGNQGNKDGAGFIKSRFC